MQTLLTGMIVMATLASGLLAGISLDKSLVQLPARQRMGDRAFAAFTRAADLGQGLIWYPLFGLGAPVLILAAALLQVVQRGHHSGTLPLLLATLLGLAHIVTTSRAAPILLTLRREAPDETTLHRLYQRFTAWHTLRCLLQVITFAVLLWTLLVISHEG